MLKIESRWQVCQRPATPCCHTRKFYAEKGGSNCHIWSKKYRTANEIGNRKS